MLTFETLSYKNFLSTGNTPTTIQLNKSTATLVVGSNGAGKSTMLDALSFALFGKPHRNINKPQLVNSINGKGCEVEVSFSLGKNRYRVFRGVKPNKFEIYKNDQLLNQESHSRDYQKVLETNILKLNHKSFHQVVVLGSSSFIPFMQLPASQRRSVIEDLLDINIFTKMNTLTKERFSKLKSEIMASANQITILEEKIRLQEKHINELKQLDLNQAAMNSKKIVELEDEVELLTKRNNVLKDDFLERYPVVTKILKDMLDDKKELEEDENHCNRTIKSIVKEAKFYEKNHKCPTCTQFIDAQFKKDKQNDLKKDAEEISDNLQQVKKDLDVLTAKIEGVVKEQEELNLIQTDIRGNEVTVDNLNKQIESLRNTSEVQSIDTTDAESELADSEQKISELQKQKKAQSTVSAYFEAIFELLKDTGIKTKVIRQYLPVMNKLINQYLQVLDFFVSFNLDESFNETIRSRHRDDFSYSSFSEGEKARIDLALLFSWRQIAKMKNSANTNLLILDETFDSSLDVDGVDNLIKILHTLKKDTNVFIISHKQDMLDGKFPNKIEFKKEHNFSTAIHS
jgi:DNA repair exonuclease SbcCD ATPase subunit